MGFFNGFLLFFGISICCLFFAVDFSLFQELSKLDIFNKVEVQYTRTPDDIVQQMVADKKIDENTARGTAFTDLWVRVQEKRRLGAEIKILTDVHTAEKTLVMYFLLVSSRHFVTVICSLFCSVWLVSSATCSVAVSSSKLLSVIAVVSGSLVTSPRV